MALQLWSCFRVVQRLLRLLDAMRPQAYGIFLVHYIFIIWLQYAVYDPAWSPFVKFAIVFAGTLAGAWATVILLKKIPFIARMICPNLTPHRLQF